MSERPSVSVAMIAYNNAGVIGEAIRGVVRQKTDFPVELIVVDDASTDSTLAVAKEWESRYPDIVHVYSNKVNLGLQRNYFEAFSHCTGKYLAMCDADDWWWCRSKLARQVAYMEAHPDCAITFHPVINYYEADGSKSISNGSQKTDATIADLSRSNFITNLSVMYRRGLVDLCALPAWVSEEKLPDYAIHMFYASHGYIHFMRLPMGVYRMRATATWSTARRYKRLEMSLSVRERLMEAFSGNKEVVDGLRQASASILLNMILCGDSGDAGQARDKLQRYPGYETLEKINAALAARAAFREPLMKRVLTPVRRFLSRLVPLPR